MARLLSQPLQGLSKQLLSAGRAASLQQEALQLGAIATDALWQPFQQAWIHSPACSRMACSAHSYHGSRDDDSNNSSSSSKKAAAKQAKQQAKQPDQQDSSCDKTNETQEFSPGHATQQLKALQDAIEAATEAVQAGQQAREAAQLPEYVARHAMRDPLGMLMTSQGVPLGISLKVNPESLWRQRRERDREAEADKRDWQDMISQTSSSSNSGADSEDQHTAVPSTDAQLLRMKLIKEMKKLVTASKAAKDRTSSIRSSSDSTATQELISSSSSNGEASAEQQQQQQQQEEAIEAAKHQSPGYHHETTVGQQVKQQLEQLFASAESDSWGTTRQSPAEIAQQIADSNRRPAGGGGGDESDGEGEDAADDEPLSLSALEERYADQAAVTAELKEMDEIYEVLAKVPWLNDEDVDERELRGVVAVGLLGTLEEVGWQLREKLLTLWAGERDLDVLTAGVGPKEAAALTAILYHTEQLEREFDKPPAAGVAAALAAAGGAPQVAAGQTEAEARAILEAAEKSTKPEN